MYSSDHEPHSHSIVLLHRGPNRSLSPCEMPCHDCSNNPCLKRFVHSTRLHPLNDLQCPNDHHRGRNFSGLEMDLLWLCTSSQCPWTFLQCSPKSCPCTSGPRGLKSAIEQGCARFAHGGYVSSLASEPSIQVSKVAALGRMISSSTSASGVLTKHWSSVAVA